MARSTGFVLAAGGVAAANEVFFAPLASTGNPSTKAIDAAESFNWRLIPATLILAGLLAGIEKVAPDFAVGLGGLVLLSVLVIPVGNAPTPLENIASVTTAGSTFVTGGKPK